MPASPEDASNAIVELVEAAVQAILAPARLADRIAEGRAHIEQIDRRGLRQALLEYRLAEHQAVVQWVAANRERLQAARSAERASCVSMGEATRWRIYRRDAFRCKYARCRRRTLYLPVLREVASVFPDLLGTNGSWHPVEQHIVYWTCTTTLEHRVSFPHGGTESETNYLTACSCCQYVKNEYPLADTLWQVDAVDATMPSPVVEAERWDGLSWSLASLRVALGRPIGDASGRPLIGGARLGSVLRNLRAGGLYYVEDVQAQRARLRGLWMSGDQLVIGRSGRWVELVNEDWIQVLPTLMGLVEL
jgi:hypothetical protein